MSEGNEDPEKLPETKSDGTDGVNSAAMVQEKGLDDFDLDIFSLNPFEVLQNGREFLENRNGENTARDVKEVKCRILMHLLKTSRMYATELTNQIEGGKKVMRNNNTEREKLEISSSQAREQLENKPARKLPEVPAAVRKTSGGDDFDFFAHTRITSQGFTVSSFQPVLLEGGVMRDYQLKALQWMVTMFRNGVNGILADEMGLGKTLEVIALICELIEKGIRGPFLIIAPLSTLGNWMEEFRKFAPKVPTLYLHGNRKRRKNVLSTIKDSVNVLGKKVMRVVITSYEVILYEKRALSKINWLHITVDEGHRMKNHNSLLSRYLVSSLGCQGRVVNFADLTARFTRGATYQRRGNFPFRTMRTFSSVGKLLLTGTPLQNNLSELWSLLNFIIPEVFNSLDAFKSWFDVQEFERDGVKFMEENYNINIITTVQQILMPFLLRREKKDVSITLPPKKEILVHCPMTTVQRVLYESTVDRSIESLLKPKRDADTFLEPQPKRPRAMFHDVRSNERLADEVEKYRQTLCLHQNTQQDFYLNIQLRNPQMQLRKIVNHPYLIQFPLIPGTTELKIDENLVKSSGKLLVVDAMLTKLKARGHKVVIFSTFTVMLDILEYFAQLRKYKYCRLDGSTKPEDRPECILKFNTDPEIFLFLVSMRAGGLGINLTGADTIIIYDSDWNPQVNLQSQDRCHRVGQTKPVVIYKLCVRGTIDQRIIERGEAKRKLGKMIIQKGKFTRGVVDSNYTTSLVDLKELKNLLSSSDYDRVIGSDNRVFTDEELDAILDRSDMMGDNPGTSEKKPIGDKIFNVLSRETEN